jgi:hypothetical protein
VAAQTGYYTDAIKNKKNTVVALNHSSPRISAVSLRR